MYRILILALVGASLTFAQPVLKTENITANSYKLQISLENSEYQIINKKGKSYISVNGYADEQKQGEPALPARSIFVAIPYGPNPQISFTNITKEDINAEPYVNPIVTRVNNKLEYKDYLGAPKLPAPQSDFEVKGFLWIGNNYCAHINVNEFKYNVSEGNVSRIVSFEINLKFGQAIPAKGPAVLHKTSMQAESVFINPDYAVNIEQKPVYKVSAADSWIDYSRTYLKIGVAADGIYKIYPEDLTGYGISSSIVNPALLKLYNKGVEVPIYVAGEEDGSFDSGDYIEFIGLRNMGGHYREVSSDGEPYNEYLGRYTDTTVYWLSWEGSAGKRAVINPQTSSQASLGELSYYNEVVHTEKNTWFDFAMQDEVERELPFWHKNKTWHEGTSYVGTRGITYNLNDVYPNAEVKIFAKLQDLASNVTINAHLFGLLVNSDTTVYDKKYIDKYEQAVLSGVLNSSKLQNGSNTLKIQSFATAATVNSCMYDWSEIEYPRYIKAVNDSLLFSFPYITQAGVYNFSVDNFNSGSFSLWKFNAASNSYYRYTASSSSGKVDLRDSVKPDDHFAIIKEESIKKPKIYYAKKFINLRSSSNSANYIAVTHNRFSALTEQYAQFIEQSYELTPKVVLTDDIYDEFSYGYFNPEAVKDFLIAAYTNWAPLKPEYVFLIGSATYDYYGNKHKNAGAPAVYNYVPSYGAPVSDNWFVIWDTTGAAYPQINIGRIPAKTEADLARYFDKSREYAGKDYTDWNKRYLFFSGGTGDNQSQLNALKAVNDYVINNYVETRPIGGDYTHFYKTITPQTNFGPYTQEEIDRTIEDGAIIISYLGHSGTQTWDNSITSVSQLQNNIGRSPFITDFGCSTGKFAEPDVISFSELFTLSEDGQAIQYIGNSSLGFTSTATLFPKIFYKKILAENVYNTSEALRLGKTEMLQSYGTFDVYKLFSYTNTLIGDPAVNLSIPEKPNLSIKQGGISLSPSSPTDKEDSILVKAVYYNYGSSPSSQYAINAEISARGTTLAQYSYTKTIPLYKDSLSFYIPINKTAGEREIRITLDSGGGIDEFNEDDNQAVYSFYVASSNIRSDLVYSNEQETSGKIKIFNPTIKPASEYIEYEISGSPGFLTGQKFTKKFDTLYTIIDLSAMSLPKGRYWFRAKLQGDDGYSINKSFYLDKENRFLLNDSVSFSSSIMTRLKYEEGSVKIDSQKNEFYLLSAGYNDGRTALIMKNSYNYIPENTLTGHHVCLFNADTYDFVLYKRFDVASGSAAVTSYINFLDTLTSDYLVFIAVSDNGPVTSSALKAQIKNLGSLYIDSLKYRGSWALIGRKGSAAGTVPESYVPQYGGMAKITKNYNFLHENGLLETPLITAVGKWKALNVDIEEEGSSTADIIPIAYTAEGLADTLDPIAFVNASYSLDSFNNKYRSAKFIIRLNAGGDGTSSILKSFGVSYLRPAEVGINYQTVGASKDSIEQGESGAIIAYIYNCGELTADSVKARINVTGVDNSVESVYETTIDSIRPGEKKRISYTYESGIISGKKEYDVTVDPDNRISELFEDNNNFMGALYVKADTSRPTIRLEFDGKDIFENQYVSASPEIKVELYDYSYLDITDTSAITIFIDSKRVNYFANSAVSYQFSRNNPKAVVRYSHEFEDGEHTLSVIAKSAGGNYSDPVTKKFMILKEPKILDVFNYPNPVSSDTYFTFKLTQIPDNLKIKIYTVAGRLIKTINSYSSGLSVDFNKIRWDCRDQDGDLIGNGVYLYKIILTKEGKNYSASGKMAVVK